MQSSYFERRIAAKRDLKLGWRNIDVKGVGQHDGPNTICKL